jgi:hypothetical protein
VGGDDDSDLGRIFEPVGLWSRLWLFCKKNSKLLLLIAAVLTCAFLFFTVERLYARHEVRNMQRDYVRLESNDDRELFVAKYAGYKLGGMVALALGDGYLENRDYGAAEVAYAKAAQILKPTIFFPRALTGRAVAMYHMGDPDGAEKLLESIIREKRFHQPFRGHAAYVLSVMLKTEGSWDGLQALATDIPSLELGGKFASMALDNCDATVERKPLPGEMLD